MKKAIALGINIITILIISIAVLALGIVALRQFIESGKSLESGISASLEQKMQKLLASTNEKVVLPEFRAQIHSGESRSFALGIQNFLEQDADFFVSVSFAGAFLTKDESHYSPQIEPEKWSVEQLGPYTLRHGEKKVLLIPVRAVGGEAGVSYVFEVNVRCSLDSALCRQYGYSQKIVVDVTR